MTSHRAKERLEALESTMTALFKHITEVKGQIRALQDYVNKLEWEKEKRRAKAAKARKAKKKLSMKAVKSRKATKKR